MHRRGQQCTTSAGEDGVGICIRQRKRTCILYHYPLSTLYIDGTETEKNVHLLHTFSYNTVEILLLASDYLDCP